ncbi:uncharacterized protein [Amphiura filiformis]|uniref:uncharacterized protein n=1 Tax=Amphiura filiformis TaxID=82378 RepID=UPI003B21F43B
MSNFFNTTSSEAPSRTSTPETGLSPVEIFGVVVGSFAILGTVIALISGIIAFIKWCHKQRKNSSGGSVPRSRSHLQSYDAVGTEELPHGLEQLSARLLGVQEENADVIIQGKIQKWRQELKKHYLREKSEIRFGMRNIDIANMDELFVGLEYFQEQGNTTDEGNNTLLDSYLLSGSDVESDLPTFYSCNDDKNTKKRKLESYKELFTLPDEHHILLFGEAGKGKTTLISRIAYDWAKKEENAGRELLEFELVVVLDIRNFQSNQTLAEAIERQLLPGASTYDIDQALVYLENKCLVLLDGFDEMPKRLKNHTLTQSSLLNKLFVIVTTRPHLRDHFCRRNKGYTRVQVSGFSEDSALLYITRFFQKSKKPHLTPSLIQKVQETPLLQALSSFPVLLVMMCLLWEDAHEPHGRSINFQSLTGLYKQAVTKYLNKPFDDKDEGLSRCEIQHVLQTIGKTALVELFVNNMQIPEEMFNDADVVEKAIEIGLLVRTEGKRVNDCSVSFIHKTFQEYCAAVCLSGLYDTNREEFHSFLGQINGRNVDEMEYLLRFSCGLNAQAAAPILALVIRLKNKSFGSQLYSNECELLVMLIYETELSFGANIECHRQLQSSNIMCKDAVWVYREEMMAAIHHFGNCTSQNARNTWLGQFKSIIIWCDFRSVQTMMQVLGSMSSLQRASIYIERHKMETPTKEQPEPLHVCTLNEFTLAGSYGVVEYNVMALVRLLSCMPALKKVSLSKIQLIGGLHGNPVILSQSLDEFGMSSGSKKCTANMYVVGYMISQLPNVFDNEASSKSNVCTIAIMPLVSLLSCMPALTTVLLDGIQLTGELDGNPVILSQFLKEFSITDSTVNPQSLESLQSCMPTQTKCQLSNCN